MDAERAVRAWEIALRRGWGVERSHFGYWRVTLPSGIWLYHHSREMTPEPGGSGYFIGPDPVTALIDADDWWKANVDNQPPAG